MALPVTGLTRREAWWALGYVAVYLAYLTVALESELVVLPMVLVRFLRPPRTRGVASILVSFGLQRGNLWRGVGWAALATLAIGVFQGMGGSSHAEEIRDVVRSGRVLWALPVAFLAMLLTAGFTEEFFFRGFLQTRLTALSGSRLVGLVASALLFGMYHMPYA
jgi:membrane protease YdiL (CAAX protease family)